MLKLALPNGSLEEKTVALFAAAGWSIKREGRRARCETDCPFVESVFFTRPQAIPRVVKDGICDIGICGFDCVLEDELCGHYRGQRSICQLAYLPYSKETNGPTHIVLCASESNHAQSWKDMPPGSEVYSEYPNLTQCYLRSLDDVRVVPSPGSTEGHVAIGHYAYGVCVMESGKTQEQNGLRVVEMMLVSETVVIGPVDLTESKRELAQKLVRRLREAL